MLLIIYRIIINIILVLSPIIILIRIFVNKEDKKRFIEKLCVFTQKKYKKNLIWFHGASVGEISSVLPLVLQLENNKKIDQILVTSSTLSSSKIFEKFKFKKTIHQFFPIDTNYFSKKFINYWKPNIAIFIDSEIWPNMFLNLKSKSIPILLLNGRITKKSFKRWKILGNFTKMIFQCFHKCLPSNNETTKYLKYFGVKNIKTIGNLKFAQNKSKSLSLPKDLKKFFLNRKVWCASSTHRGEEFICMKVHQILKKKYKNLLSIVIPRHIDRSKELLEMYNNHNLKVHCHSWKNKKLNEIDIYLVDTYGETEKFFNLVKTVFIGGSLINHGGQNPLEPARHGCKVLHGPYVNNFKNIYNYLKQIHVTKKIKSEKSLKKSIEILIKNKKNTKSLIRKVKKLGDKILISAKKEIEKSIIK